MSSSRAWLMPMLAADVDVVAGDVAGEAVAQDRHEADVVGEHVDVVVARPRHADLELAGQVDVAVDRLGRALAAARALGRQRRRRGGARPSRRRPTAPSTTRSAGGSGRRCSATSGSSTAWRSSGHGDPMMLRTTSPHAASVVSTAAVDAVRRARAARPCARRGTARPGGWSGASCRRPARPGDRGPATARRVSLPPGTDARTMHE